VPLNKFYKKPIVDALKEADTSDIFCPILDFFKYFKEIKK